MLKTFNFLNEIKEYEQEMVETLQLLLKIPSEYDETTFTDTTPFGIKINEALLFMLKKAQQDGFETFNDDGYVGVITYGEGERFGVLCHLDVVPAGQNWTYPPYEARLVDGKIYARGAMDDKGPLIASYFALKMLKNLGIKLNKKIEFILGTDEETKWRGIEHFSNKYGLPECGFSPDADFPLIYGEKGILRLMIEGIAPITVTNIVAGERFNVVIDEATFVSKQLSKKTFMDYLNEEGLEGNIDNVDDQNIFVIKGLSAHAMEPFKGVNAGTYMAKLLREDCTLFAFINQYFHGDHHLLNTGLKYEHPEMGIATSNIGIIKTENDKMSIGVDIRYPLGFPLDKLMTFLDEKSHEFGFAYQVVENKSPHYVDPSDPLVQTLHKAYIKYTGDDVSKPLTIGGGTYARALKKGVAFGMEMPGSESLVHQKDEYVKVEDLLKAASIYAESLYQIGGQNETKKL